MTFLAQNALANDFEFQRRITACLQGQALVFKDDARPDFVALADSILRVEPTTLPTWFATVAGAPGFVDEADPEGDGSVDSSLIDDAEILSAVQANWQVVAGLFFDDAGAST